MNRSHVRDVATSVRQRLKNLSVAQKEDFQRNLIRYGLERFLYRLGQSRYADRFVLKGALLFSLWGGDVRRPTRDIDLRGSGSNSVAELEEIFREVGKLEVEEDGLKFLEESVQGTEAHGNRRVPPSRPTPEPVTTFASNTES